MTVIWDIAQVLAGIALVLWTASFTLSVALSLVRIARALEELLSVIKDQQ